MTQFHEWKQKDKRDRLCASQKRDSFAGLNNIKAAKEFAGTSTFAFKQLLEQQLNTIISDLLVCRSNINQ